MLRKLELYGVTGCALALIQSYLSDRTQKCQLADKMSSERDVKCGILQGSILGPLLLFADDTNLTVAGEAIGEVELAMNIDLARIKE